uniref:Uncharacterized protein YydD, contains DUF2326 domain n=1 Tax=Candidatus Kentrum sp. UNK TaxID=2126344 RepID=A0A451AHH4_9GAMM|nr:MAG: Uncharacterized protein YydD, contains DUF2326 domain [Candidatus Kentron sp. UNK]VFK72413.1 MAG: Uncharacterized protein YydD, contains DUF2326 domain [Candidatus Kentron sp. UNK]
MKLVQLACDQPSFRTLRFRPEGVNLIIGDGSETTAEEGSSNGVGKTLALGLVHHCLGANTDPGLAAAVPDWMFRLDFSIGGDQHVIERSGDGKKLFLNAKQLDGVKKLRGWLDENGPFNLDENIERLSFRSLFARFARHYREDCSQPLRTKKEQEYDGLLRSFYLLGADCSLIVNKRRHKLELDKVKKAANNWKEDQILREIFRAGAKPEVRLKWLDQEILRIRSDLKEFEIAEDYRQIELLAGNLTKKLREVEKQQAIIDFQIDGIDKALVLQPDISRNDLLLLYEGLESIFRSETLAHFKAVETFHNGLSVNRKKRLEGDRLTLWAQREQIEQDRRLAAGERDRHLQSLQGKRALDEYASLARNLAAMEEERERLREFLTFSDKIQEREQEIKEQMIQEDREAANYTHGEPLEFADGWFRELVELLYPGQASGIVLENNTGISQKRYDLTVQIEGDDSDGINDARIVCFDWILMMRGANHSMDFLWHDNRLFADMDPRPRAAWFSNIMQSIDGTGKQYIATINTENYESMSAFLSESETKKLNDVTLLTLRGDRAEHKLLGIQFGKPES